MEIIKKISLQILWEIIRRNTIVIWCLILYNPIMECNMSLKVHFLDSHLDFFQENLGGVSTTQRQQFHQDISTMEKWYQDKWSPSTLDDYSWTMRRNIPQAKYSRKSSTVSRKVIYEGWNFNSDNYLFTTDTK